VVIDEIHLVVMSFQMALVEMLIDIGKKQVGVLVQQDIDISVLLLNKKCNFN
jgi:hypothetical protein